MRLMKIVVGILTAPGSASACLPSVLCCLASPELSSAVPASPGIWQSSRLTLVGSAGGAGSYVPVGAFLCFLPPLLRFLPVGASEADCPGVALTRDTGDAGRKLDLHGLSAGAAHGNQGDMNPLLGRTPLA